MYHLTDRKADRQFENSVDEILEREGTLESDREATDQVPQTDRQTDRQVENSADEILEREGTLESDREATDQEVGIT